MANLKPWEYIPLSEHDVPAAPVAELANRGLRKFWHRVRRDRGKPSEPFPEIAHQSTVEIFNALFAAPDWDLLSAKLGELAVSEVENGRRRQVFVGGPHRRTADILRNVARGNGWSIVEAPSPHRIMGGHVELPSCEADSVVVIPELAQWFLRHDSGLDVLRHLLDWILLAPCQIIVGCNSWAWSYLDVAIQLGVALPHPRVLAPLDASALRSWLSAQATAPVDQSTHFREASTGKIVLTLNGSDPAGDDGPSGGEPSSILTHIAAHGRGLPEIMWRLWRESFLQFKAGMLTRAAVKAVARKSERTIWMTSWNQMKLPEFPDRPGHLHLFIKHALLLHAGLDDFILQLLLPFPRGEILRGLHELQSLGIVELEEGRWRVTLAGYPAVRGALSDEGYLVDEL